MNFISNTLIYFFGKFNQNYNKLLNNFLKFQEKILKYY